MLKQIPKQWNLISKVLMILVKVNNCYPKKKYAESKNAFGFYSQTKIRQPS